MSHTAFFYGTLMAPPVLHRVIWGQPKPPTPAHANLLTIRPAILHAHRRHKVRHADYPAILPTSSSTSSVRGTLVTGLTDGDIWRLDIFEGSEYKRQEVTVRILSDEDGVGDLKKDESENREGEEVRAETYIWVGGEKRLEREEWDFDQFVKEKMGAWVGFRWGGGEEEVEEGIQDVDAAVAAQTDPTGGRGANGKITRELEEGGTKEEEAEAMKSAV